MNEHVNIIDIQVRIKGKSFLWNQIRILIKNMMKCSLKSNQFQIHKGLSFGNKSKQITVDEMKLLLQRPDGSLKY